MLFQPMAEPTPHVLHEPGLQSLTALDGLNGYDQLQITCRHVVGILLAYRPAFAGSREREVDFDALCDGLMEWLEAEIAPLRFTRPN